MAMLFTVLLGLSIVSWIYIIFSAVGDRVIEHIIPLSIGIFCTVSVVIISYLISVFVVKKINHIASSAAAIVNTQDFSQRIKSNTNWDDLSNLANILNILLANIKELLVDIKSVSNNIAHDLKTPLTRLKNKLEDLEQTNPNKDSSDALAECNQLLDIFNSLLRLNLLEHGRESLTKKRLDIKNIIDDAIELYEPIFEQKNIQLQTNILAKKLNLNKNLIFQSIINILDNCYKYSKDNTEISINTKIQNSKYIIEIADQGIGINNENTDKIFERFFREEKSRSQTGNGLGLALVKKIIQLHNGDIIAQNNKPQGLKMIISLPLH
ncbi:HAMP domain-containing sensor histidine kinase [Francisella tularensis]|uniref:HAMP domain-containing sensor histidine kinase n=2 Tax=Francisella tularensis TaxID=263 RepID=UPI0000F59196|nr:HAMP domain-containing sensor histidine kinase [Francisella tularensis]ABO46320.1 two-component system sensor histidine kinase [Francisella tularensis subsp. tularensis WY96-3418]EKM88373.1 two-component system sensor histidine kinase [Francisella tularensis subsp. tularensis 831]EKM88514.1 two-component system sensor histidine kinase [Francisella tularensis subsp. tularensis AS_713]EKM91943.1 two-component system sensor histidine kinase [Francisella tularensis subsp. tularensis 70102010]EK